jgi:hypothetical protein
MKKSVFAIVSILILVVALAGLSACGKTPEDPEDYGVYQLAAIDPRVKGRDFTFEFENID